MTIYICKEFLCDLMDHAGANFASRVLKKVLTRNGGFAPDADDHRFDGIENAWIRYVSTQGTAFRAIFIKKDGDIYWYRAGEHSVEDSAKPPKSLAGAIAVRDSPIQFSPFENSAHPSFLKTKRHKYLRSYIAARSLLPHKSLTIVVPKVSRESFSSVGIMGLFMNRALEAGASVTLITNPPATSDISFYRELSCRCDLLIHDELNVRLLISEIDTSALDKDLAHVTSSALIGSSDLSSEGLGEGGKGPEELTYEIPHGDLPGAEEFVLQLIDSTKKLDHYIAMKS